MKYTQRELLENDGNGGFWSGFKPKNWGKVARGAIRAGADVARTLAPEITNPIDQLDSKLRGYAHSFEQGYAGIPDPLVLKSDAKQRIGASVAHKLYNDISLGLARSNIEIMPDHGVKEHGINPKNGEKSYILKGVSAKHPRGEWLVVNNKGIRI